jgi:hypothetical protein
MMAAHFHAWSACGAPPWRARYGLVPGTTDLTRRHAAAARAPSLVECSPVAPRTGSRTVQDFFSAGRG